MALTFFIAALSKAETVGWAGQMTLVVVWSTLACFWMVPNLIAQLYTSPEITLLYHLPVEDKVIFRRRWTEFMKSAAFWTVVDVAVIFGFLNYFTNTRPGLIFMPLLLIVATFHAVAIVSCTILAARLAPNFPYRLVVWGFVMGILLPAWIGNKAALGFFWGLLEQASKWPVWLVPTGWMTRSYTELMAGNWMIALLPLPALVFLASAARATYINLRSNYNLDESIAPNPSVSGNPIASGEEVNPPGGTLTAGITEIEDSIRGRRFLLPSKPDADDLLDRCIARTFTPREREIAELFMPSKPRWSRGWKRACVTLLVMAAIGFLAYVFGIPIWSLVYYVVGAVSILAVTPLMNPLSAGFQALFLSGTNIPIYAGFPVGFRDLSRIVLKIALIRCLAGFPLVLLYSVGCAALAGYSIIDGAIFGAKASWVILAAQPFLVVAYFSSGTNDTKIETRRVASVIPMLVLALLVVAFGVATMAARNPNIALPCAIVFGVLSSALHWIYERQFNKGRFDLVQIPQPS